MVDCHKAGNKITPSVKPKKGKGSGCTITGCTCHETQKCGEKGGKKKAPFKKGCPQYDY